MTSPCHVPDPSLDLFDPLEESVDEPNEECYGDESNPFCNLGFGDSEGFCIRPCYVIECSKNG